MTETFILKIVAIPSACLTLIALFGTYWDKKKLSARVKELENFREVDKKAIGVLSRKVSKLIRLLDKNTF